MGTEENKHQERSNNETSRLDKLVEVGSYSRLTKKNLKRSMQTVFPDKPGDIFVSVQQGRKKVEKVKLAGLTEEENKQLNFILTGLEASE